ncbi:hypothetical protein B0J11DRAFT_499781 [Dendryphion nanum]|uniref:Uncharacterized protein n=1 Tax=Dendryphion nanum TaxID=256645 RepID=A0A9P9I755_9PLEO|nr:hypothetical protein B0J11DRAFT_499781 [Dendryphion nanum]
MIRIRFQIIFLSCYFLISQIFCGPSVSAPEFNGLNLIPYGGIKAPSTGHLEIRGVLGGRKKRYIFKREEPGRACCREKFCLSLLGEILDKDCKCQKCPIPKVPELSGKDCQDECPIPGTVKTPDGKGCCKPGEKQNPAGISCELDYDKKQKKGNCPEGSVLDPKEGPQDMNKPNPACTPDDEKNCPPGTVPQTRALANDNDPNIKKECGKPEPNDTKQCNPKKHYVHYDVYDDEGGTRVAKKRCKQTREYQQRKKSTRDKLKDWKQKKWDEEKPRKKAEQAEKEKQKQEQEQKKKDQNEKNEKKKGRMGQCFPLVALLMGSGMGPVAPSGTEHPYEWTTEYFDEGFVGSEEVMEYWPSDVEFEENVNVDIKAFQTNWIDAINGRILENTKHQNCPGSRKRCKRSTGEFSTVENATLPSPLQSIQAKYENNSRHEKRYWQTVVAAIASFVRTLAQVLPRAISQSIGRAVPRLANKGTDKLFQLARSGQGASGGTQSMKAAAQRISQSSSWKNCLRSGKPG